jgi:hypothetical protein
VGAHCVSIRRDAQRSKFAREARSHVRSNVHSSKSRRREALTNREAPTFNRSATRRVVQSESALRYRLAMDPPHTRFAVTPWRNSKELLQLRHDLYGSDASKKERAVNKVSRACKASRVTVVISAKPRINRAMLMASNVGFCMAVTKV